jgi:type II secretory pathway component PulK
MTRRSANRWQAPRRSGAAVVVVLAVFAVTMILAGVWTRQLISENRSQRLAADRMQARWLAEAGVRRAAAQLMDDENYDGQQWHVAAEELGGAHPAMVQIRVEAGESSGQFKLIARARYPARNHRAQVTKTVHFTLPSEESQQ